MKLFCILLSLILIVSKILGAISLSWIMCLLPVLIYLGIKIIFWIVVIILAIVDER
jgi:hypothetical protein